MEKQTEGHSPCRQSIIAYALPQQLIKLNKKCLEMEVLYNKAKWNLVMSVMPFLTFKKVYIASVWFSSFP